MALSFCPQPQIERPSCLVYASQCQNFEQSENLASSCKYSCYNRIKPFNMFIGTKLIYSMKILISYTCYNGPWGYWINKVHKVSVFITCLLCAKNIMVSKNKHSFSSWSLLSSERNNEMVTEICVRVDSTR